MLCASAVALLAVTLVVAYFPLVAITSVTMPTAVTSVLARTTISALVQTFVAVLSSALVQTNVPAFGFTAVASLVPTQGLHLPSGTLTMSSTPQPLPRPWFFTPILISSYSESPVTRPMASLWLHIT